MSKAEERDLVDLLSNMSEEELLQREMGYFWTMTVKMRGLITAFAVLIPDALFLFFGILGFFNIAGIHVGVRHELAYLAIAIAGFALSFLMWRVTSVALTMLLRAIYVLVTGITCLVIGTSSLIYQFHYSNHLFPFLINVGALNDIMWLIVGLLTFLVPLLLAYPALRYYLIIMAYGRLW